MSGITPVVGRAAEQVRLKRLLNSPDPELLAVYGRRRIGKTFLIRQFFRKQMLFELTGLHDETIERQLENFAITLRTYFPKSKYKTPKSWLEAFEQLKRLIGKRVQKIKRVLFFDEFPWLDSRRSGFLAAFENFWNTFASTRSDLVVVICGSAASWMIRKVIGSKGGLHNRTSARMRLEPFTLGETKEYLQSRNVDLDDYQIAQLYMSLGGVPHYLNHVEAGQSAAQNIDRLCFAKDGMLVDEYHNLYAALFEFYDNHEMIVEALASKNKGLTRSELLEMTGMPSGGGFTKTLNELIESGFVHVSPPRDNILRDALFRLADEYSLFYLRWIKSNRTQGSDIWVKKSSGRKYESWCGYAFENMCFKHISQIKEAIGIGAVETTETSWRHQPKMKSDEGAQLDLVIDRKDRCTNICEVKFSRYPYTITKNYADDLQRKVRVFGQETRSQNTIFLTLITAFGLKENRHSQSLVSSEVTLKDLMR